MRQFKARYNLFILNGKLSIQRLKGSRQVKYATKGLIIDHMSEELHLLIIKALIKKGCKKLALNHFENTITMLKSLGIRKIDYLPVDYYSLEPDGKIVAKITSDSNGVRTFYMTMFSIVNALTNIVIVYVDFRFSCDIKCRRMT